MVQNGSLLPPNERSSLGVVLPYEGGVQNLTDRQEVRDLRRTDSVSIFEGLKSNKVY